VIFVAAMGAATSTESGQCIGSELLTGDWSDGSDEEFQNSCSSQQYSPNTVIVFDWDDTLLCSTAIHTQRWRRHDVRKLQRSVKRILRAAMRLGETLIVTNGNATWVEDSAREYMPGLLPLLSQLSIVSARAQFEDKYPGDPFMWKRAAFEHLLTKTRTFSGEQGLNLVVLGDQYPEIDAAHYVAWMRVEPTRLKAIKFKEAPSTLELVGQLGRAERQLENIVNDPDDRCQGIVCRHLSPDSDELVPEMSAKLQVAALKQAPVDPIAGLREIWQLFV